MNLSGILLVNNLKIFHDWGFLQHYSQSRRPHGSQPFHDLPGTIPLFHHSNPEAINGGTASGGCSNWQLFWEQPVTKEPAALWIALLIIFLNTCVHRNWQLYLHGQPKRGPTSHGWWYNTLGLDHKRQWWKLQSWYGSIHCSLQWNVHVSAPTPWKLKAIFHRSF